jgi:hypothetical protein
MKHRISNFVNRLLGPVVNQIAPYWYLAITPKKIIMNKIKAQLVVIMNKSKLTDNPLP